MLLAPFTSSCGIRLSSLLHLILFVEDTAVGPRCHSYTPLNAQRASERCIDVMVLREGTKENRSHLERNDSLDVPLLNISVCMLH